MLFAQLDTNWPENPKRIRAGLDGSAIHAICLCLAKRMDTNGWIDRVTLSLYGGTDDLIDRLVSLDLLDKDGERVRPHGWDEVNLSSEAIRLRKSESARMANHARWHDGGFESCEVCTEKARSSEADPTPIRPDPTTSYKSEGETESEGESEGPPDPTFDNFWDAYPRHDDKIAARKAWTKAIRSTKPDLIVAGALRYAGDPEREDTFTKLPATWLNKGAWANGPLPARHRTTNGMAASTNRLRSMIQPALGTGETG